jgi:glycosyltransferase involved in cell wall biosynthesis
MKQIHSIQVLRRFTFDEWGGTETVVWNMAKMLQSLGHPVEIAATKALCANEFEKIEEIPIRRFSYFYPSLFLPPKHAAMLDKKGGNPYSPKLYNYLIKQKNIQLLHCHTMQRLANTVRLAAKKLSIPYLVSFHGGNYDVPKEEMDSMLQPLKHTFNYGKIFDIILQNQRFLDDSAGIICVGKNEYELTKQKYPNKPVIYLPNGVDIDKFSHEPAISFRETYHIPQQIPNLLCVGRIDGQKNQLLLLDLLQKLKQKNIPVHITFIGPITSQAYLDKLEHKIESLGISNSVTIIPGLQADDPLLISAYKESDIFVLPSIHEPFGIVVLEAWAAGLPVIASRVGGLAHLITDEKTGFLFEANALEELEKYVIALLESKNLAAQLSGQAFAEVSSTYSWRSITDLLLAFYQEIIS